MKLYIKSSSYDIQTISVIVNLQLDYSDDVAAATYHKGDGDFAIPDGPLLPRDKEIKIDPNSQILEDYKSFITSVRGLLENYYELNVYYKNHSDDNSYYFGMLAKDDQGNNILDFDATLRLSNHPAHRTPESENNKKKQKELLLEETHGQKTRPLFTSILVNDEEFDNYLDAYQKVDEWIDHAVKIMKRRLSKHGV